MKTQAHMSGQISGQVTSQAGPQFHGIPQQNGNPLQSHSLTLTGQRNTIVMDPEVKLRRFMQGKILEFLERKQEQLTLPREKKPREKIIDIVKRLEYSLYKAARSKDEYVNLATLESRLVSMIRRSRMENQTAQNSYLVNPSSSFGAMIPTPGTTQNNNSNVMISSSGNDVVVPEATSNIISSLTASTGSLVPNASGTFSTMHGCSLHTIEGSLSNGYQQVLSNFSTNAGGNVSAPADEPRVASEMIPTPGCSNNNNNFVVDVESASNAGSSSGVDSSTTLQQIQQKQHGGGQDSCQVVESKEDSHPAMKRMKLELPSDSAVPEIESLFTPFNAQNGYQLLRELQPQEVLSTGLKINSELAEVKLRKMPDLLVHASQCRSTQCQYLNCRKVKALFRHGFQCKVRASGGCVLCKRCGMFFNSIHELAKNQYAMYHVAGT